MCNMKLFWEVFGWYGACAFLLAYLLVSFHVIDPVSFWYQFLNLTAAIGVAGVTILHRSYQSAILNIIWGAIALVVLLRIFLS